METESTSVIPISRRVFFAAVFVWNQGFVGGGAATPRNADDECHQNAKQMKTVGRGLAPAETLMFYPTITRSKSLL